MYKTTKQPGLHKFKLQHLKRMEMAQKQQTISQLAKMKKKKIKDHIIPVYSMQKKQGREGLKILRKIISIRFGASVDHEMQNK